MNKKDMQKLEQELSIFDFLNFDEFVPVKKTAKKKKAAKKEKVDKEVALAIAESTLSEVMEEDYLHREERILSLVKERKITAAVSDDEHLAKMFSRSTITNNKAKGRYHLAMYIVERLMEVVRPMIIAGIDSSNRTYTMTEELRKLVGKNAITDFIDGLQLTGIAGIALHYASGDTGLAFHCDNGPSGYKEDYTVDKMKPSKTGDVRHYRGQKDSTVRINDVAVLYARAVMYNTVVTYIRNCELATDKIANTAMECAKSATDCYCDDKEMVVTDGSSEAITLCQKLGKLYRIVEGDYKITKNDNFRSILKSTSFEDRCFSKSTYCEVLGYMDTNVCRYINGTPSILRGYISAGDTDLHLSHLFGMLIEQEYEDIEIRKYERENFSDYAKSYQTKKNIPEKILNAMKSSEFNKAFGYVEFDEDCDVTKVEELYKEFDAINSILAQEKKEDVVLRFRKLGNHKAAGLYYSTLQNICIDIRHPDSFIHEYFHMLDYTNGGLSGQYAFARVIDAYKAALNDAMKENKKLEKSMKGNTKYNLNYYFIPTEIFARSAESYITQVLGVKNSLVKIDMSQSFAYPQTEDYIAAMTEYFDWFMLKYCRYQRVIPIEELPKIKGGVG